MNTSTLKWICFVTIAVTFLSFLPQLRFWLVRGAQWQGAYATVDGDEFLYSAYINALIDGRPRRNDPFGGRNDNPNAPLPESAFSIQLMPPFVIASLAKTFGASASTAFVVLIGVAGFLGSLAIFSLLLSLTGDNRLSGVGTLMVICFGTAAAGHGLLGLLITGDASVGFLFLRRYQPAADFFLFFIFCLLVWRALVVNTVSPARLYSSLAGICLVVLVFSYLYLWTAALAWLLCALLFWFLFRRREMHRIVNVFSILIGTALLAIPPYLYLVFNRAANLTETQTLISTRRPDVFRIPELIGVGMIVLLILAVRSKRIGADDPRFIFGLSFATVPLILFNQQLVTGTSIQAFHFEEFIANYVVLVCVVIVICLWSPSFHHRVWLWLCVLCIVWGAIEVDLPAQARYTSDVVNDEMIPVLRRLKALSFEDGTISKLNLDGKAPAMVFSPHSEVMRLLPTWTPYGTLLGLGGLDFGSATREERRVFTYLYYSGVNTERFRQLLDGKSEDGFMNYYTRSAVFGHERVLSKLTYHFEPIRPSEIDDQVRLYEGHVASFSREEALKYPIGYIIVLADSGFDFSRLDRWYERDAGERVGPYYLYRVRPRNFSLMD